MMNSSPNSQDKVSAKVSRKPTALSPTSRINLYRKTIHRGSSVKTPKEKNSTRILPLGGRGTRRRRLYNTRNKKYHKSRKSNQ